MKSIMLKGEDLARAREIDNLMRELEDRRRVIQERANSQMAEATESVAEEIEQLRLAIGQSLNLGSDLQFWRLMLAFVEHNAAFLILDEEAAAQAAARGAMHKLAGSGE